MPPHSDFLLAALLLGIGATVVMDLWAALLKAVFNVPSLDYCLVGRWTAHLARGRLRHDHIARTARVGGECTLGWLNHYATGIVFAGILLAINGVDWIAEPSVGPALALGLMTLAAPFLVMQPSMGLGIAAARTPDPMKARLRSLSAHAAFGVGLYVAALLLGSLPILRAP